MTTTPCANDPRFTSDDPGDRAEAAEVCGGCGVAAACWAGAEERDEPWGVWAGRDRGAPGRVEMANPDEPQVAHVRVTVYGLAAHSTRRRYQQGCRCDPCTASNTVAVAEHRAAHQFDPPKPDVPRSEPLSMFAEIPAVTTKRRLMA